MKGKNRNKILFVLNTKKKSKATVIFQPLKEIYDVRFLSRKELSTTAISSEDIILTDDTHFFLEADDIKQQCFKFLYYTLEDKLILWEGRIPDGNTYSSTNFKLENKIEVIFQHFEKERHLDIRRAEQADLMTYFHWANDPEVRSSAINSTKIALEDHQKWFTARLHNSSSRLFLFEKDKYPLGQVRFDIGEMGQYEIDYSISKEYRGEGYGKLILFRSVKKLIKEDLKRPLVINALVKNTNKPSNKVFLSLGFEKTEEINMNGQLYYKYQWSIL